MKKFLPLLLILMLFLTGCNNNSMNNQENRQNYNTSRVSTEKNISDGTNNIATQPETELSSFSTKIYTPNDEARQNNIRITCSKLDGTIVKSRRDIFFL